MSLNSSIDAPQWQTVRAGDTSGARVDYTDQLRTGETISSITSITLTGESTAVTASAAAASTGALAILGSTVSAGAAVTFTITATSTASPGAYYATVTSVTTASQVMVRKVGISVVG